MLKRWDFIKFFSLRFYLYSKKEKTKKGCVALPYLCSRNYNERELLTFISQHYDQESNN